MNTATPFPTFTPFPTPGGTPMLDLAPITGMLDSAAMGPQVVQFWQMWVAPQYAGISAVMLFVLVVLLFIEFIYLFRNM